MSNQWLPSRRGAWFDGRHVQFGLLLWLLLSVAAICFWPALTGPFVFDDFPNLQNLAQLQGRLDRESVGLYLASFLGNPGRPLSTLSFLIEDADWPTSPLAFKRNNLLLHLVCGCLVFLLVRKLAHANGGNGRRTAWVALIVTAMWMLHPMQLSATMLVVQRMTILSAIFVLMGLLAYLRIIDDRRCATLWRVPLAGIVLSFFAVLAFLCKENGVLAFAYATALNLTLLRNRIASFSKPQARLLQWGIASPLLLLAMLAVIYPAHVLADYAVRDFSLTDRLLSECRILFNYLGTIMLPRIGGTGVFHDDYVVSRSLWEPWTTFPAMLALLTLLAAATSLRRLAPLFAFSVFWFMAGHLIESTVLPLELYFDHRNYIPMLGPLSGAVISIARLERKWRLAGIAVLVCWIGVAALSTRYNAGIWGNRGRLAEVWSLQQPKSARATQMLASYRADIGDVEGARKAFDKAIARITNNSSLKLQRILLDCIDRGVTRVEWSNAVILVRQERYDRGLLDVASSLVKKTVENGCNGTLSRADARALLATLLANPAYSDRDSRGFLYYELSRLDLADRNLEALMRHMDLANQYRPNPMVAREQAIYLLTAGLPHEALLYLDRSDAGRIPSFKEWLLQMPRRNAGLRESALRMIQARDRSEIRS